MDEDLGGFFGPPMLTFVVEHFFLLQTQLSKLMFFFDSDTFTHQKGNQSKEALASGEHGFQPGLSCAHFFPRTG